MRKHNRSITADLTPLLDMIFILLFLILIRNAQATEAREAEAAEAIAEAREQTAAAEQLREEVQGRLEEYETLLADAEICYISIALEESGRVIRLEQGSSLESYRFDWDSMVAAEKYLKDRILEKADGKEEGTQLYLVFRYNVARMYQSDYEMVGHVLELAGRRKNVFVQYRAEE